MSKRYNYSTLANTSKSPMGPLRSSGAPSGYYASVDPDNTTARILNPAYNVNQNCNNFDDRFNTPGASIPYLDASGSNGTLKCTTIHDQVQDLYYGKITCNPDKPGMTKNSAPLTCCGDGDTPYLIMPMDLLDPTSIAKCLVQPPPTSGNYMCGSNKTCVPAPSGTDPSLLYKLSDCDNECNLSGAPVNFWAYNAFTETKNINVLTKDVCTLIKENGNGCNDLDNGLKDATGNKVLKNGGWCNWDGIAGPASGVNINFYKGTGSTWPPEANNCPTNREIIPAEGPYAGRWRGLEHDTNDNWLPVCAAKFSLTPRNQNACE